MSELKKNSFPTIDVEGKPIVQTARDLTNLFCCGDLFIADNSTKLGKETKIAHILASKLHTEAVAEFVNRELLAHHRTQAQHNKKSANEKAMNGKAPTKKEESDEVESFGTKRNFKSHKSTLKLKPESNNEIRAQV